MKINYDKVADAVYISFGKGKISKTIRVNENTLVDVDSKDKVLGYEILNYSEHQDVRALEKNVEEGIPVNITQTTPSVC